MNITDHNTKTLAPSLVHAPLVGALKLVAAFGRYWPLFEDSGPLVSYEMAVFGRLAGHSGACGLQDSGYRQLMKNSAACSICVPVGRDYVPFKFQVCPGGALNLPQVQLRNGTKRNRMGHENEKYRENEIGRVLRPEASPTTIGRPAPLSRVLESRTRPPPQVSRLLPAP